MAHEIVNETPDGSLRADAERAARTLATITVVGAVAGMFVVGVLARLAMRLLAALNPDATGVISDDGFVMGQFTLSGSVQLLGAGLQIGLIGAVCYALVRGLLVGPPWFRLVSISLGPAVVIGALIVHTDGVDFPLLDPPELAVALFVALPAVYVALVHLISERALRSGGARSRALLVVGLAPWVLLLPVGLILAVGFLAFRAWRRSEDGRELLASPWPAWALRGGLAVVFVMSLLDLRSDLATLS